MRAATVRTDQQALLGLGESPRFALVLTDSAAPSMSLGSAESGTEGLCAQAARREGGMARSPAEDHTGALHSSLRKIPEGRRDRSPPRGACPRRSPSNGNSPKIRDITPFNGRVLDEIDDLTKLLKVLDSTQDILKITRKKSDVATRQDQ